jgi:hypothetical protein
VVDLAEPSDTPDIIILRAPRGRGTLPVMRVVIGGVASRHALSVDRLDDIELALETLFREEPVEGNDLTLAVSVVDETFKVAVGGLSSQRVRQTLAGTERSDLGRDALSDVLRMLMDSLVDGYRTADGPTPGSFSVEMEKRIT